MYDVANAYINKGIAANAAKDFKGAYENFHKAYEFKLENGLGTDTTMLYNAALMAQSAGDYANAIKATQKLIDMGYKGLQFKATDTKTGEIQEFANRNQMLNSLKNSDGRYVDPVVEGDLRPDLYISLANLHKKSGDTIQYDVVVSKGRTMFPGNKSLLLLELQKYLDTKEYDKAMVNLEQAMITDPNNELYPYLQGYIYQTEVKDYDKAKAAYAKAIAINPDKIEAQYMTGLLYVDKANEITEIMNGLKLNEKAKYDKLQKEQQEAFSNALPFFVKAREIDPKDMDTLKALKEVYYKLKMYQEAKEVQAVIDAAAARATSPLVESTKKVASNSITAVIRLTTNMQSFLG
jgi:tetratricopeptide (TPR) repeat protein